jgi:hypothetical protein
MRIDEIEGKAMNATLSPAQARLKAMRQNIDRQKEALANERERQHDAKHAEQMRKLHTKTMGL